MSNGTDKEGRMTAPIDPRAGAAQRRAAGFTLTEMIVAIAVLLVVMSSVLVLFTQSARIAAVQTEVADAQQTSRIAQLDVVRAVRMAGRGPLPTLLFPNGPFPGRRLPNGVAVSVQNNVAAGTVVGDVGTPFVMPNTDILTIRGVLTSPVYMHNPGDPGFTLIDNDADGIPDQGTLILRRQTTSGITQRLDRIQDAITRTNAGQPEALVLVSSFDDGIYAVVEMGAGSATVTDASGDVVQAQINFTVSGGTNTVSYLSLTPNNTFPVEMTAVGSVGVLEELRFYIREEYAIPGDNTTDLMPKLSIARFYPGTNVPYAVDTANTRIDLADDVFDLQVAMGIDGAGGPDGRIIEDQPPSANDEWLYNHGADNDGDPDWNGNALTPSRLFYLRISTLVRTGRPDLNYTSPPVAAIEDHVYAEPAIPVSDTDKIERSHRRRIQTTVVDLRNLT